MPSSEMLAVGIQGRFGSGEGVTGVEVDALGLGIHGRPPNRKRRLGKGLPAGRGSADDGGFAVYPVQCLTSATDVKGTGAAHSERRHPG
jgi:hypothetical protein